MSTIRELFEGELRPWETRFYNQSYQSARFDYDRLCEQLKSGLSEEEGQLLNEIIGKVYDMEYEYGREMFVIGFSLGVRLTAEGFCTEI